MGEAIRRQMKTIVTLIPVITRMLETAEYAVDALLNAINAMANDTTVTAKQGDLKRSAMKLKAKGKEIAWSESDKTEYVAPACAPLAFNAWHDAMANVFKAHGDPAGCLLYTSDAADERSSVDLGGRRIIKKKKKKK